MSTAVRTAFFVIPFIVSAMACGGAEGTLDETAPPVNVQAARAAVRPMARTFEAGGVIRARTTAHLSSRIAAEVTEVRVRAGDRVRRGQVLVRLDNRDLAAQRAQADASAGAARNTAMSAAAEAESAEARLTLAQVHHRRVAELRQKNSATAQELDQVTAELNMAEAALRAARSRHAAASAGIAATGAAVRAAEVAASFADVAAPFDGVVASTQIDPGNTVAPGVPLLTIEAVDRFRLEVQVDESRARSLHAGSRVRVTFDETEEGGTTSGRIVEIGRAIDPTAHAFVVKVELPEDATVRSGMFARARFDTGTREALVVPASAVVRRGQLSLVFAVDDDGRARMRAITVGGSDGEATEVLAGVRAGELVIVKPPAALADRAAVRVTGERP